MCWLLCPNCASMRHACCIGVAFCEKSSTLCDNQRGRQTQASLQVCAVIIEVLNPAGWVIATRRPVTRRNTAVVFLVKKKKKKTLRDFSVGGEIHNWNRKVQNKCKKEEEKRRLFSGGKFATGTEKCKRNVKKKKKRQ